MAWAVKNWPAKQETWEIDPWVGKIPWRRKWPPTLIFLPGKSHGHSIISLHIWPPARTTVIDLVVYFLSKYQWLTYVSINSFLKCLCKQYTRDFLSSPVIKNPPSNAGHVGSTPGRGTKIPDAKGLLSLCVTMMSPHATTRGTLRTTGKICALHILSPKCPCLS